MRKTAMLVGMLMAFATSYGQARVVDSIISEGDVLYHLENACWKGTEMFLQKHKQYRDSIGGVFAYHINDANVRGIFYSLDQSPHVIASVLFDTSFDPVTAKLFLDNREFSTLEQRLYNLRNRTMDEIDRDTSFNLYENTSFSIIPIIDSISTRVYIMTTPEVKGVVVFGNDYLLNFDFRDSLAQKRPLHKDMIQVDYAREEDANLTQTFHTHSQVAGKYITPTDICVLKLYGKYSRWKEHIVMGGNYISLWDVESDELTILTRDQWNKLNNGKKHSAKR